MTKDNNKIILPMTLMIHAILPANILLTHFMKWRKDKKLYVAFYKTH